MTTLRLFFKNTLIYGIATVLPRVINFLLVNVHTNVLSTKEFAENTNFYIWIGLIMVFLTFGLETTFFRFYKEKSPEKRLFSTAFLTILFLAIVFIGVAVLGFNTLLHYFDFSENPLQLKLMISILVLDCLMVIPLAYLRVKQFSSKYTLIKLVNVLIIVALNLFFLKHVPTSESLQAFFGFNEIALVNYIFIANLIGSLVSFLWLSKYLFKFTWGFDASLLKRMLAYSWPIVIAGIAYIINENLDKILIKKIEGDHYMGVYSACYKLAIFMNLFIAAFKLGAEPFFFKIASEKNAKTTYATILHYFIITGSFVFIGVVVYLDWIKFYINKAYWEALSIVPIILLANLMLGIYHNFSVWYKITDKTRFGMYFSLIGALITIVLNLIFIPIMGYMAAAWVTLIAYSFMALISFWVGKKHYSIPYRLFKSGKYIILAILLVYTSFIYFRENWLISTTFVLFFTSFCYFMERKNLRGLLRKKR